VGGARRIAPRSAEAQAAQPGPLVFQPIDALDASPGAKVPPRAVNARFGVRLAVAIGAATAVLAGLTVLTFALWPHAPVAAGDSVVDVPAVRATLPCIVGGRMIGRFTLQDCANRNGVASGSLRASPLPPDLGRTRTQADATPPPAARPPPSRASGPSPGLVEPPRAAAARPTDALAAAPAPPVATSDREAASMSPPAGTDAEHRVIAQVPLRRASALAVQEFYDALGKGDGARAAAVVVQEKREEGPLSAQALTKFYSSLRAPLRVTKLDPIDDDTVFVRYQFVTADDHLCLGTATVSTAHRDGDTLVKGVHAFSGC
jgi:hypothetical protein